MCTEENVFCTYHPLTDSFTFFVPDVIFWSILVASMLLLVVSVSLGMWLTRNSRVGVRAEVMLTIAGANLVLAFCAGEFVLDGQPQWRERTAFLVGSFVTARLLSWGFARCSVPAVFQWLSVRVLVELGVAGVFFFSENAVVQNPTVQEDSASKWMFLVSVTLTLAPVVNSVWQSILRSFGTFLVLRLRVGLVARCSLLAAAVSGLRSGPVLVLCSPLPPGLSGEPSSVVLRGPPGGRGAFGPLSPILGFFVCRPRPSGHSQGVFSDLGVSGLLGGWDGWFGARRAAAGCCSVAGGGCSGSAR